MSSTTRRAAAKRILGGLLLPALPAAAAAQSQSSVGVTDKEIRIGHVGPYSGPASAFGVVGKAIGAYFDKVNAEGGIHGRKINFITVDDGYNPAKTVEQTRRLVEQEEVFLIFNLLGTPSNTAVHKYLNAKKVPQLFVCSGATKWGDPKGFPWTMGWQPSYQSEAKVFAAHILETRPQARVAVLYQNDDYGKDYLKGFEDGLGDRAKSLIVARASYEVTDPTVDSQIPQLKSSGADTFFNIASPKFAAQAIKKAADIGWKPTHYLNGIAASVGAVLVPAGLDNSLGILTTAYLKDPTDPQFQQGKEWEDWLAWMKTYHPKGDLKDNFNVYAYSVSQTLVQVLKQAGSQPTRENVMQQAASLDMDLPMLLPGINVKTGPDDYFPIERSQLMRFNGKSWEVFGRVYGR